MILGIDPGNHLGWCLLRDDGEIIACGLGLDTLKENGWGTAIGTTRGIIEMPTIYPRSKARPADILKLAYEAGKVVGELEALGGIRFETVEPRTWKGQVPKTIHNRRILANLSTPSQYTFSVCVDKLADSLVPNVIDAVGLAVWYHKRLR